MKTSIFSKIFLSLIISGLFLISIFIALSYEELKVEFYLIFSLVVIFIFLFSLTIGQRLVSPIKEITRKAIELSKGSLKTRIYLETKDEFEELARVFNQIAEELERSHSMVEKAKNTVSVKVRARTKELEESIESLKQKVKNRARERELEIIELKKALQQAQGEAQRLKEELKEYKK